MGVRENLVDEMIERATQAGDAAGIYLIRESTAVVMGPDGPTEPLQIVVRYAVGERAFLPAADVDALAQRRAEDELLERALGPSVAELRREADEGPLGDLS
jgi:hypothetical protein